MTRAIVLAGGKGARLLPYTTIFPKPLMPIGDMPILEIMLRQMKRAGVKDVVLTVGHLAELLRAFFKDGRDFGLNIEYSFEDKPLGTAGPLSLIEGLSDTFLVANGDVLTTLDLTNLLDYHRKKGALATIAMHARRVKVDLGVLDFNDGYELTGYREKPNFDFHVSMGIYVFEPGVLAYIEHNSYLDFPNLVQILLDAGERVVCYPFDGYWQDLGRPDDYEQAQVDFEKIRPEILGEEE